MDFNTVLNAHAAYKTKLIKWLLGVGGALLIMIIIAVCVKDLSTYLYYGIFVLLFGLLIVAFATRKSKEEYRRAYKAYFVEKNLAAVFTELSYYRDLGLNSNILRNTGMINTGDRYHSNDLVSGKYKDTDFTQADVHIETEHTDSDGNTHYSTIFRGRWMIFDFPRQFNFRLQVVQRGFGAAMRRSSRATTGRRFERIRVESPEFNKLFKVYAEDGFETFYLLDPSFIHNIVQLKQIHKGKIMLGFSNNQLFVGLNDGKDAFEPPFVFKKLDEAAEITKVTKDIHLITDFVDQLKLNNKLFK